MDPVSRVFIVQQPTRRDPDTREIVPSMDLSPARRYGPLVWLLRPNENPFDEPSRTLGMLRTGFRNLNYAPRDFLLLVGNPILIGLTAIAAAEALRGAPLRLLQWDRPTREYVPAVVRLGVPVPPAFDPQQVR